MEDSSELDIEKEYEEFQASKEEELKSGGSEDMESKPLTVNLPVTSTKESPLLEQPTSRNSPARATDLDYHNEIMNEIRNQTISTDKESQPSKANDPAETEDLNEKLVIEKRFNDFEIKFAKLEAENRILKDENSQLLQKQVELVPAVSLNDNSQLEYELDMIKNELLEVKTDCQSKNNELRKLRKQVNDERERASQLEEKCSLMEYKVSMRDEELRTKNILLQRLELSLNDKSAEESRQKHDSNGIMETIRNELQQKTKDAISAESLANSLSSRNEELEKQLFHKISEIKELKDMKATSEQNFMEEIKAQKKLTSVFEQQYNIIMNDNSELKSLVDEMDSRIQELTKSYEKSIADNKLKDEQYSIKIKKLEFELSKTENELKIVNSDLLKNSVSVQIGHLSGTAAAASQIQNAGKSITEMYSEYSRIQQELIAEKGEVHRLNECLNHIVKEFEERAPLIQKTNDEYQKSKEQIEVLTEKLQTAIGEKNVALKEKGKVIAELNEKNHELQLQAKEILDRSQQVQALLREQYILKGGHSSAAPPEPESDNSLIGADRVISERLVVFRNIEELQMQNQNLLRSIRSLSIQMEQQEAASKSHVEAMQLESIQETTKIIEKLKEQLKRERQNSESYRKERDTWKQLIENRKIPQKQEKIEFSIPNSHTNCEFEVKLHQLEEDFEIYKKESTSHNKKLQSQLNEVENENTNLTTQIMKLNNQIEYMNQRHEFFQNNVESRNREFEKLQEMMNIMNSMSEKQDNRLSEMSDALLNTQQELASAISKYERIKAEYDSIKESEDRFLKDREESIKEKNIAYERVRELRENLETKDEHYNTEIARLQEQVSELQKDLKISRKQLSDILDDNRQSVERKEAEISQLRTQISKMTRDYENTKSALAVLKEKNVNNSAVDELLLKLASIEQKSLSVGENAAPTSNNEELKKMQLTLIEARKELSAAKSELVLAKEQVAVYKAISQSSESRLMELNNTSETYREETQKLIAELQEKIISLEKAIAEKQATFEHELSALQLVNNSLETKNNELTLAQSSFDSQMDSIRESERMALKFVEIAKGDVETLKNSNMELQENYEREVRAHSAALDKLADIKELNSIFEKERATSLAEKQTLQKKLKETGIKFEEAQSKFETERRILTEQIEDLTTQNDLLHAQFQQLSITRAKLVNVDNTGSDNQQDTIELQKQVSNLMELVNNAQRQRSILQNRLDVSTRECERFQIEISSLRKSLEDSRVLLEKNTLNIEDTVSKQQYQNLLAKLENANLHRESNITLRTQLEIGQKRISELEKMVSELNDGCEPLQRQIRDLTGEIESRKRAVEKLKKDNILWKQRASDLLDKYKQIDPALHEALKEKVVSLESAVAQFKTEALNLNEMIQKLSQDLNQKEIQLNELRGKDSGLDKLLQEKENLNKKLEADVAKLQGDLKQIIKSSNENTKKAKASRATLKSENSMLKHQIQELNSSIDELNATVEELKKAQLKGTLDNLTKMDQMKIEIARPSTEFETPAAGTNIENAANEEEQNVAGVLESDMVTTSSITNDIEVERMQENLDHPKSNLLPAVPAESREENEAAENPSFQQHQPLDLPFSFVKPLVQENTDKINNENLNKVEKSLSANNNNIAAAKFSFVQSPATPEKSQQSSTTTPQSGVVPGFRFINTKQDNPFAVTSNTFQSPNVGNNTGFTEQKPLNISTNDATYKNDSIDSEPNEKVQIEQKSSSSSVKTVPAESQKRERDSPEKVEEAHSKRARVNSTELLLPDEDDKDDVSEEELSEENDDDDEQDEIDRFLNNETDKIDIEVQNQPKTDKEDSTVATIQQNTNLPPTPAVITTDTSTPSKEAPPLLVTSSIGPKIENNISTEIEKARPKVSIVRPHAIPIVAPNEVKAAAKSISSIRSMTEPTLPKDANLQPAVSQEINSRKPRPLVNQLVNQTTLQTAKSSDEKLQEMKQKLLAKKAEKSKAEGNSRGGYKTRGGKKG